MVSLDGTSPTYKIMAGSLRLLMT